jgi:hypothetical protein
VNSWVEAQITRYGAILIGLGVGLAAKHGLALSEGRSLTWRGLATDLLLVGMVGVLAMNVVERLALTGNAAVLVSALFAISSDRVVRLARERFLKRVDRQLQEDIDKAKGELRNAVQAEASARNLLNDYRGDDA